ncbi:CRISPR-associated endonuclease Cas2 [[Clostridium] innocuum]|nr:CRISPR-associated endonuclease Cas2 [[Clostridium] innocuum]
MLVIITYDVNTQNSAGKKRLRNVAKVCVNYGQRVQNSVFECVMDQAKCREVKHKLTGLIDKEHDSLRFYYLGNNYKNKVEHIGVSLASMLKKMYCLYELFCANRKLT